MTELSAPCLKPYALCLMLYLVCIHEYVAQKKPYWCWHNLACEVLLRSFESWNICRTFCLKIFRNSYVGCIKTFYENTSIKILSVSGICHQKSQCINGDTRNLFHFSQVTAHHLQSICSFSKTHAMAGVTEVMLCALEWSLIAVCVKGNQAASRKPKRCESLSLDNFSL